MQELFRFDQRGRDASGKVAGEYTFTGIRPRILDRVEQRGIAPAKVLELHTRRT
jgi:pilus assembly protein CpaF